MEPFVSVGPYCTPKSRIGIQVKRFSPTRRRKLVNNRMHGSSPEDEETTNSIGQECNGMLNPWPAKVFVKSPSFQKIRDPELPPKASTPNISRNPQLCPKSSK